MNYWIVAFTYLVVSVLVGYSLTRLARQSIRRSGDRR